MTVFTIFKKGVSFLILLQNLFCIDPSKERGQLVMKIGKIEIYEIE